MTLRQCDYPNCHKQAKAKEILEMYGYKTKVHVCDRHRGGTPKGWLNGLPDFKSKRGMAKKASASPLEPRSPQKRTNTKAPPAVQ